jgi:hypothetical protein
VIPSEFADLCARISGWWPHARWPQESAALYFQDLKDLPADQVATAAEALYRDGRDFPPTGAQIRGKVLDLAADVPGFGLVWDRLFRAASLFGQARGEEALEWLADWHPLAGEFARTLPFREFCLTESPEVMHGQARRSWEQLCARHSRDARMADLPSAGLRAVERASAEVVPIGKAIERALPRGGDVA